MSTPKPRLGRGLGALIPTEPPATTAGIDRPRDVFFGGDDAGSGQAASRARSKARANDDAELMAVPGASFAHVPVDQIVPNPRQPRTVFDPELLAELVGSIKEIGVLQPIVVRPNPAGAGYELIMGE